jgi:hypothetical protein
LKLRLKFLAYIGRSGSVAVEILDVELDLMEECLDGQSDRVVVGWLGKMLLPGVFRVHEVVTGTFE